MGDESLLPDVKMEDERKSVEDREKERREERDEYPRMTPFQRAEARVMATGNRWAIENWRATHY